MSARSVDRPLLFQSEVHSHGTECGDHGFFLGIDMELLRRKLKAYVMATHVQ